MDNHNFPKELAALCQWVCWRLEKDNKTGRDAKVPYTPSSGNKASASDPSKWGTLDEAIYNKDKYFFSGVGFVFTAECGIIGIDIDHCIMDGKPNEVAAAILERLPATYIEVSPSGSGLHIFLKGVAPSGGNRNSESGVEMYSKSRYFTMTGIRWKDCTDEIAVDNGVIEWIHKTFIAPPKKRGRGTSTATVSIADDELLKLAKTSKDGEMFDKLYRGDWQEKYKSQSEADFALCCKLAFWSGRNEAQIDRIFRSSGLYREKWDTSHSADGSTYGLQTVRNACTNTDKTYMPPQKPTAREVFEHSGSYYRDKNQKVYQLTNFIIEPIEMVTAEDESQLSCVLVTTRGERFEQVFESNDFANLQRLKNVLSKRTIALSFFGGECDLEQFKQFVYGLGWAKKTGVKTLGIYPNKNSLIFVDTKGAVGVGGKKIDAKVQLDKHKQIESDILTASMITKDELVILGKYILSYNVYQRTVPMIAWCAGCFVKPHLRRNRIKFPHLFLVGEKGGGKTTSLEWVILPFFGRNSAVGAAMCKPFGLMKESNSSNVIPQAIEEFKPNELPPVCLNALRSHFRDSWDIHEGIRGRSDLSVVKYELLAPIVVAGEQDPNDGAIRERIIELLFSKRDINNDDCYAALQWIKANENIVRSFGRSLLDIALRTTKKEALEWHSEGRNYFNDKLPERIIDNLCSVYAGLCLINKLCQFHGLAFEDVFPIDHEACAKNLDDCVRKYLLDDSNYNKGVIEQSFEVMARMKLKYGIDYAFENNGQYLFMHFQTFYDRFRRYCHDYNVGFNDLDIDQFRVQLAQTAYFVSKNRQKWIDKQNKKCWVIDFHKLEQTCDVSGLEHDDEEEQSVSDS